MTASQEDARAATPVFRVERAEPTRINARAQSGLSRAFALAINAGQSDTTRTETRANSSRANSSRVDSNFVNSARATPIVTQITLRVPAAPTQKARVMRQQIPTARPVVIASRPARIASENIADSRVTLAALASPISPVRTISSARLRTAAFSDDSMRPRVAHPSAAGRRLARLMPDEGATPLRVSRPMAQAPTLREVSFGSADNGPKLDELRSAVDDYRASVAGDE